LFWLDNTLRMNSAGRTSMPLYSNAIGIFHEKYAQLSPLPHWMPPPHPPPPPGYPIPMSGYGGMSPPPDHGIPPPYGPNFTGPYHPHIPLPSTSNIPLPILEPSVKQERMVDDFQDVEMR